MTPDGSKIPCNSDKKRHATAEMRSDCGIVALVARIYLHIKRKDQKNLN
jgi:hypothetical protein